MKLHKKVMKSALVRAVLCRVGASYMRLVHATNRWTIVGGHIPERLWRQNRPFIVVFWHGRMLMTPFAWDRSRPISILHSAHGDGALIGQLSAHFDGRTIVGSSSRGGAGAVREIVRTLNGGTSCAITPDGPRGPRMRAQSGIVAIARLAGVPVVPLVYGCSRGKVLTSWDRFLVALPLGRGVYIWGQPIEVEADADAASQRRALEEIETSLNALTRQADRQTGRVPVEPAARPSARAILEIPGRTG